MISAVEQDLAAHSRACKRIPPCLTCRAYGELLAQREELWTELADARTRLQSLAAVVELARSGLASALLQATNDDPAGDVPVDLAVVELPPVVPLYRLPMRQDTPTNASTPAAASAEADQAPTT